MNRVILMHILNAKDLHLSGDISQNDTGDFAAG